MKRLIAILFAVILSANVCAAAPTLAGSTCSKLGITKIQNGKIFTCIKVGKKFQFNKGVVKATTPQSVPVPPPTALPLQNVGRISLTDPISFPSKVVIPEDCSVSHTCPAPTPTRIEQTETCHAMVSAVLQKEVNGAWVDASPAQGWEKIDSCPASNPYHPWTVASIEFGTTLRWKVWAPGAWDWFGSPFTYLPTKSVSQSVIDKRTALEKLATEPASTFTPTSACQILDAVTSTRSFSTDLSAGFPRVRIRLPNTGHIKALIIPVDFRDQIGKDDPIQFFTPLAKDVRDFYAAQSYGKVAFDFQIVPNWVRVPFLSTKYGMGKSVGQGDPTGYRNEIIRLTDGLIDYSNYDEVYFLVPKEMPMSVMGWGPGYTTPTYTSTGYTTNGAVGGADMYFNIPYVNGSMWKWMAHETGHTFGLYDEDYLHQSATLGNWSIMAMNWSKEAIELGAWDRYLLGWLPESQIKCTPRSSLTSLTVKLSPIVRQDSALKSVMVPISATKILIVESRKNEGFDTIRDNHTGVIAYTIDFTKPQLGGGYVLIPRPGSSQADYSDAALHEGSTVSVDGITIKVDSISQDGDTVTLSTN